MKKKKKNQKRRVYAIVIACEVVIIAALACFLVPKFISGDFFQKKDIPAASVIPDGEGIMKYDNGDVTYQPPVENIAVDKTEYVLYYNNTLNVYLFQEMSAAECEKLAESVDGELCGCISGVINMFQIKVEESSLDELREKADQLKKDDRVLAADFDSPLLSENTAADSDPWNYDGKNSISDKNREDAPGGNDWWAEAIGAYTAWEIYDACDIAVPYPVGVIDSGFNTEHVELKGNTIFMRGDDINVPDSHGTGVAGLIGAKHNDKGMRGVADRSKLICVDWKHGKTYFKNAAEFIEMNKALIENGAKVINNSYGFTLLCEKGYNKDTFGDPEAKRAWKICKEELLPDALYADYLKLVDFAAEASAKICMTEIFCLLYSGQKDFIFVQAAGNGYNNCWGQEDADVKTCGHNAYYSGYYDAISKELFDAYNSEIDNRFTDNGVTYEMIAEHKISVGAVCNNKDKKGRYLAALGSSYGTTVDIFAPGDSLFTLDYRTENADHKKLGNEKNYLYTNDFSGTSGAAPIVSGSLALLWSLKPSMSAGELKALVCNKTHVAAGVGVDAESTYPMLNVGAAAKAIVNEEDTDTPSQPSDEGEWKQALEARLYELLGSYDAPENGTFELYDADGDSVPEIYLCAEHFHAASGLGFSYQNGKYVRMGEFSEFGAIHYNTENHIFKCIYGGMGAQNHTIKKISGGVLTEEAAYSSHEMLGANEVIYTVNGEETDQAEYEKLYSYYDSLEWIDLGEKYALTAPNIKAALAELFGKPADPPTDPPADPPADTPDNGKTDKLYVPVRFKKVTSYSDSSDTISMLYRLNWSDGKVQCDYEGDVTDFYFGTDGKLTSGAYSSAGGYAVYDYSFDYSGNILTGGKIDEKFSTDGEYPDSSSSDIAFGGNGKLNNINYSGLTSGARASVKRNASGTATSASYSDSASGGDTVYYYEDADHPDRLTKTELTNGDCQGTLVLRYAYDNEGRLISVSTETPFYFFWGPSKPSSEVRYTVTLSYDANGCLSQAEYVIDRDEERTAEKVEITYMEATDAQYSVYRDMAACSFTPAVPDVYLPLLGVFDTIGFILA